MVTEFLWHGDDLVFIYEGQKWILKKPTLEEVDKLLTKGALGRAYVFEEPYNSKLIQDIPQPSGNCF